MLGWADLALAALALGAVILLTLRVLREEGPGPGEQGPDFTLPDHEGRSVTLSQLRGRWVVLAFYPLANTKG